MTPLASPTSRSCPTTDNGPAYVSVAHALACRALGIKHIRTQPYRPHTNGKAEYLIRTMLREWACAAAYGSSLERTAALSRWLERYNFSIASSEELSEPSRE